MTKPTAKPQNPCFSSGPCAKHPGWSLEGLAHFLPGRSHRAGPAKAQLKDVIEKSRKILGIPDDYKLGIVPASDTGAVEMAMWAMLGERGVDVFAWENFSRDWLLDAQDHLQLVDLRLFEADYGQIPDLAQADPARDIIFAWNGTTSGVRVPNADWIAAGRAGLTICDATSAVFAYDMDWSKLDVVTWSWQKVLGSEAAHGMIALSPRAVERLETFKAPRPLPKIFRMTKKGKLNDGIFAGETINTPSMLAVADCLDALNWVESIGGLKATIKRSQDSFDAIAAWVEKSSWAALLAEDPATRSTTSVCLKITDEWFTAQDNETQTALVGALAKALEKENVAFDIKAYRTAPAGLRIWCGATVEPSDVSALLPWLDWAYESVKQDAAEKAA